MNKLKLKYDVRKSSKKINVISTKVSKRVETSSVTLKILKETLKWTVIIFFAFLILFPFYYMISMSLMSYDEITHTGDNSGNSKPIINPSDPEWGNYATAFRNGYFQAFLFSSSVLVVNIVLKLIVCMMLGYAFGNYNFKGKGVLWSIFMVTLAIPEVALLSGQWWVVLQLNAIDGLMLLFTLSAPYVASIFTAYMFRNAFEEIPVSVKEAALIDGCSGTRYFMTIALPMVKQTVWTVVILTTFASWNSYMWPSLVLGASDLETIPLWLFNVGNNIDGLGDASKMHYEVQMAGSVLALIPTLIFYLIFRNKINDVVSAGSANKG